MNRFRNHFLDDIQLDSIITMTSNYYYAYTINIFCTIDKLRRFDIASEISIARFLFFFCQFSFPFFSFLFFRSISIIIVQECWLDFPERLAVPVIAFVFFFFLLYQAPFLSCGRSRDPRSQAIDEGIYRENNRSSISHDRLRVPRVPYVT